MRAFFLLTTLVQISCAVSSKTNSQPWPADLNKFAGVQVGDPASKVEEILGTPVSLNSEKFSAVEYKVLEYSTRNRDPSAFYVIDTKTSLVAGRSIWISKSDPEGNLSKLLKEKFPKGSFKRFIPCQSSGPEEVLIDQAQGVSIAMQDKKVQLIMWSDPTLTRYRIDRFFEKCPKLQVANPED
jgi:hypothetical protein